MATKKELKHEFGDDKPVARMKAVGYKHGYWCENVPTGPKDGTAAVALWMTSAGHKKNILSDKVKEIGIGVKFDDEGNAYWCQNFADLSDD